MQYTCVRCGKQFEAKRKTAVCPECHTAVCCVCGKQFEVNWPYTAVTCSTECRGKYMSMSGKTKAAHEKAKQTVKENGSKNVSLKPRKCEYCGKIFIPNSNRQKYCGEDYGPCPVCSKSVKIKDMSIGPQACSYECRQKLIEQTNLDKYGVKNVFQSDDVKEQSKKTCLDKYGVESYSSTDEYHEKYTNTMQERYGVDHPLQSINIKDRARASILEKYGVPWNCMRKEARDYHTISKINKEFAQKLDSNNIRYELEFPLENRSYDFHILNTNILIEIDPTITHNSYLDIFDKNSSGLDKYYHRDKTNLARKYGYRCIHIFDWDDEESIIRNMFSDNAEIESNTIYCDLSKSDGSEYSKLNMKLKEFIEPVKIWSRGRYTIFDTYVKNEKSLLNDGWLPVFNCGYEVYTR